EWRRWRRRIRRIVMNGAPVPDQPQTLGDVTQQAQGADNYLQQYDQAIDFMRRKFAPAQAHMDAPSVLKNILSFGHAGADYNATQAYNAALDRMAVEAGMQVVNSRARSEAIASDSALKQMGLQLNAARTLTAVQSLLHRVSEDEANRRYKGTS